MLPDRVSNPGPLTYESGSYTDKMTKVLNKCYSRCPFHYKSWPKIVPNRLHNFMLKLLRGANRHLYPVPSTFVYNLTPYENYYKFKFKFIQSQKAQKEHNNVKNEKNK